MSGVLPLGPNDAVLGVLLAGACWTDVRTQRIRNVLTFPMMLAGVLTAPFALPGWWWGLGGLLAAFALAVPGWRFGGAIRAGDVKLLMAAGALTGPETAVRAVLFAYMLALPFGVAVLAVRGRLGRLWDFWARGERDTPTLVAYAPVIAVSVLLARLQPWPDLWS